MDRRTYLAIGLSFLLLVLYQWYLSVYYPQPTPAQLAAQQAGQGGAPDAVPEAPMNGQVPPPGQPQAVAAAPGGGMPPPVMNAAESPVAAAPATMPINALAPVDRGALTPLSNALVEGGVQSVGGRLADLQFLQYRDQLGDQGRPIRFLDGEAGHYFVSESGYFANPGIAMPGPETPWRVVPGSPEGQTRLVWDNGAGLTFEKIFTLQPDAYLLEVTDRMTNGSGEPVQVHHYAQLVRSQPVAEEGDLTEWDFQGPMGYLGEERVQFEYDDLREQPQYVMSQGGWAGFSDKYFLAALAEGQTSSAGARKFYFDYDPANRHHRTGMVAPPRTLAPGQTELFTTRLFIGPKATRILRAADMHLERSIDYGWVHFLSEPLVKLLLWFNDFLHNYGLAIIMLTLMIKLLFFPLANKSYRSMSAMKKLQPKVEQLRKQYGDDRAKMNQEMMKLYQDNQVNPLGGCLPIVVQIPVFFALYKVLLLSIEMRHEPFFLWIHDLSAMDPFYVLPILMGASMFLQQKLNPAPADPMQAKIMMFLPLIFTVMFLTFPSGLVLYWLVNNVLSIAQQAYIMKKTA